MTAYLYGRPPAVFDPPTEAIQTSPLIPGSARLEDVQPGSAEAVTVLAPPGALERLYVLALVLRALRPGGRLDVMAPKDKGGARLAKELAGLGVVGEATSKAHHKRIEAVRPEGLTGLDEVIQANGLSFSPDGRFQTQPGIFAWDRLDAGTAMLIERLPPMQGAGADLGCGWGALAGHVLVSSGVTSLRLIDLDRRAIAAAKANVQDPRAAFEWANLRALPADGTLDFVVSNPPFHLAGEESRSLGQSFVRQAAAMLKTGGVAWIVANRHLPYEAELKAAFKRLRVVDEGGGYKIFEAIK